MRIPDLQIAGAPKCGTSSLFNWLNSHPKICGSKPKETFFFIDEDNPLKNSNNNVHDHGIERCQEYFHHCIEGQVTFEATTHYIFQDTAIRYFSNYQTDSLIIFVLRKPSDRVFSSFNYTVNNLGCLEKEVSFFKYVDAILNQKEDQLRPHFHSKRSEYVLLNDINYSRYIDYLNKWEHAVGRDRMHVILFENMIANPFNTISTLCEKVGIDSTFYDGFDFDQKNKTYNIKNQALHRLVKKLYKTGGRILLKDYLKKMYYFFQSKEKQEISQEDRHALERLNEHYLEANRELAQKFNLDLSIWEK